MKKPDSHASIRGLQDSGLDQRDLRASADDQGESGHYITLTAPHPSRWARLSEALRPLGLVPVWLGTGAIATGLGAAIWYARAGLTLSHYDAKAHLVVSRRILDSLTPGWEQIGAVWLPLPHLINMLPVQIDYFYRTGSFAVALSIVQHGVATAALAATVQALTASRTGAALAALLYALNPNVLYLQSTPMTEPLLFALTALQVWLFTRWVMAGRLTVRADAGWITVLACLTRYEAWFITATCFVGAAYAWWRRGHSVRAVARVMSRLAVYPLATVALFLVFSRITVGEWFVSGGFFVPDETLRGQPLAVIEKIAEGVELVTGVWLLRVAALAALAVGFLALATAGRAAMVLTLAPFAAAALPFAAYLSGHPFRMRYEIPLVVACALVAGAGVGLLRTLAPVAAVGILALVVWEHGPLDQRAPMIAEAQLDPNVAARAQVTSCLVERYRGGTIMMSMGSLGHYMQEMSAAGFAIKDFLHEGNGPIWDSAFTRGPAPLVEWVMVEEFAEGGDAVALRHRAYPRLLEDYDRVCLGGNVALYQRKGHRGTETQR